MCFGGRRGAQKREDTKKRKGTKKKRNSVVRSAKSSSRRGRERIRAKDRKRTQRKPRRPVLFRAAGCAASAREVRSQLPSERPPARGGSLFSPPLRRMWGR